MVNYKNSSPILKVSSVLEMFRKCIISAVDARVCFLLSLIIRHGHLTGIEPVEGLTAPNDSHSAKQICWFEPVLLICLLNYHMYPYPVAVPSPGRPYRGKPSDMWALGVVLFTMLYGQFPFYDSIPQELFRKIKAAEYSIPEWVILQGHCPTALFIRTELSVITKMEFNL